jgi:transcriptional regulator with PAS, ATPase and Fis domain
MVITQNNFFKRILESYIDDLVFQIDLDDKFKILQINKDILSNLGLKKNNLLDSSFLNLIFEKDVYKFIDYIKTPFKKGKNSYQIRLIDNKKKPIWYELKKFDTDTFSNRIIIVLKNITKLKSIEKKLNETEERLKLISDMVPEISYWKLINPKDGKDAVKKSREMLETVIDTIPQLIYWKDENLKYLGCNQKFASISGFKRPHSLIGKTVL